MRAALFLFVLVVFTSTNLSGSFADSHSSDEEPVNEEVTAKLAIKLPSFFSSPKKPVTTVFFAEVLFINSEIIQ